MFGEWITEEILYPLPHRQYVFTIPKILRPYFRFDRELLGKLSQLAYQSLKEFFRMTLNRQDGVPGAVISIQTFGDLVNFHPHLHCLVTDGCFMPNGWFYVLPEIDVKKLGGLFRHKVFKMLLREKKISREWVDKLLSWENSGFNIHNQVKIQSHDSHLLKMKQYGRTVTRMATPTIKSTYTLDVDTIRALEDIARRWGVSKSEALRRAVRSAAGKSRTGGSDTLAALDRLQESLSLTSAKARVWARSVRKERLASSLRHEPGRR